MEQLPNLLLEILTQIGGGPKSPENNLVRFALPAIFWLILFAVAWTRQRQGDYPRERLLLWGFGLAFFRELFMLAHWSEKLIRKGEEVTHSIYVEPLEHVLSIAALILIAAAFLRYILDDHVLPRHYLVIGLGSLITIFAITAFWWPDQVALNTNARFNMTVPALVMHSIELLFIGAAIIILIRRKGWLRNIVIIAFTLLFVSSLITLFNYLTNHSYGLILCPIGNNLHIWAVPILGFVYFREQAIEKREAEGALRAYQDHLEDLVEVRTAELQRANKQLERAAVLEERQRIAAEMHDGLAQTLSTIGLKTGQASERLQDGQVDEVVLGFDEIQDVIGRAVNDVRRSIASLQQDPKPMQSLQEALDEVISEVQTYDYNADIEKTFDQSPIYLITSDQEQVVRVVQEGLLNACRHAQASLITIRLERSIGGVSTIIEDDGTGFDIARIGQNGGNHFGLSIMRARASRLNGRITIESVPGSGTTLRLSWPAEFIPHLTDEQSSTEEIYLTS